MRFSGILRLFKDLVDTAREEKKLWLIPLMMLLILTAGLFALGTFAGQIAPFFYPLF